MDELPFSLAFVTVKERFVGPAILFYLASDANKRKGGDNLNSLTAKPVPAGTKLVHFGRYVLNINVGIVQYILRKTKTRRAKIYLPTQCTNQRICMILTSAKNTRCAWAGGTFFTVVLLSQFLVLVGNRFWFYLLMYLEYNTVVVLC
jgi:hypothetical protein